MVSGLTNASKYFHAINVQDFKLFYWKFCGGFYFDDVFIYNQSLSEHLDHLSVVFEVLRAACLFGNLEMCTFCIEQVSFLDYRDSVGD